jgi:RHS repeat-associated protein
MNGNCDINEPNTRTKYSYDLNSNISTKVSPKPDQLGNPQTTIDYYYDVNSRLYKKTYTNPDASTVEYGYDGSMISCGQNPPTISSPTNLIGRRSAMCAGLSGTSWSFDPMGRPLLETTITNGGGNQTKLSVQYSYNLDGSPNMITYPSGDVVTYTPGGAGRSLGVSDSSTAYVASGSNHATYSPNGAVTSMTNGYTGRFAGIVTTNVYNDRLQPLLLSASTPSSTLFQLCYDFHVGTAISNGPCQINQYTTGDNGNLYQVLNHSDSTRSAAYIYDPLNRIAQAYTVNTNSANCWGETYSSIATAPGVLPSPANLGIDPWGNLTNKSAVSGMGGGCATTSLSQTANTNNQLSGSTYDAAGNITNDGNGNQPTYDDEDRIVTDAGVTYSYDADGMRIEKSSGTKYWYGSGGEILAETSLAGTINEEYIYFAGQRIARVDRPSGTVHYYFSNHIGSHTMITSATGACEQDIDYFPYGGVVTDHCPNVSQRYKFTGKERDSESGLDNFGARYNASSMGRFMTPDPSNLSVDFWLPQTWNRYAYALNNPLAVVDRNGLWPWYIHNEIIDEAFPGLSKSQLQSLKTASANVDKDQSPAGSYKHGMGNGDAVNNTTTPGDTSDYIHQNEQTAEQVQADWIASGHTGIAPGAMTAFGNALHTVTDMTSPAHEGYQLWYGTWDFFGVTAAYHFLSESRISDARRNTAIAAARQTFMNTFGWMALQNATDGLTPKVTHKICYPDENGKQSCQ